MRQESQQQQQILMASQQVQGRALKSHKIFIITMNEFLERVAYNRYAISKNTSRMQDHTNQRIIVCNYS